MSWKDLEWAAIISCDGTSGSCPDLWALTSCPECFMFTCNSGSETEILALLSLEISSELLGIGAADRRRMDVAVLGMWLKYDTIGQSHGTSPKVKDELSVEIQGNRINSDSGVSPLVRHPRQGKHTSKRCLHTQLHYSNIHGRPERETPLMDEQVEYAIRKPRNIIQPPKGKNSNIYRNILQTRRLCSKWNKPDMVPSHVYWVLWAGKVIEIKGRRHLSRTKRRECK